MSIVTKFGDIRVRTKLYLFMLIPIFTMIALISGAIGEKYSEKSEFLAIYRFSAVVFDIADLVHELQKERGLSAGFVGSRGMRYRDDLKNQRQQTQHRLKLLKQRLINVDPQNHYWGLQNQFNLLLIELQRLPDIRYQIDQLDSGKHFDYYSNINEIAIGITRYLQVKSQDLKLSRLGDSYSLLLDLQERSGQERGALNGVFSQRQLNTIEFQEIVVYIALQRNAIRNFFTVAEENYQDMLRQSITHPVVAEVEAMREAAFNKWERNELLNELHSLIGYGGLIHDFNNYVISGDARYYEQFTTIFFRAQQTLSKFRQISSLGEQELAQIDALKRTFKNYQNLLDTVTKMHSRGASIKDIDDAVQVDDTAALDAIEQLRSDITTFDTTTWWPKATQRIALIKKVSETTRKDISQTISQLRTAADRGYFFYVILMLSVLTITLMLGYLLINRLANETSRIASAMHQMRRSGNFDQLLKSAGNDEIGEIVTAFNNLVDRRNQTEKERREIQQQLLETKKREALLTLSGGVAHNFNNKLTTILGYTSLALNLDETKNAPQTRKYLNKVAHSTEEASELIEKILTYSQSNFLSREKSVMVDGVVHDSIQQFRQQLPSNIRIVEQIDKQLPSVRLDADQFRRSLEALQLNSMEAMPDGGTITIGLQVKEIIGEICSVCGENVEGDYIELSIEDSGIGIPDENIEHIFEPFFTTKELSEGAGMGLAMVYGFINKMGGHITVESTPGRGSKFKVILPLAETTPANES